MIVDAVYIMITLSLLFICYDLSMFSRRLYCHASIALSLLSRCILPILGRLCSRELLWSLTRRLILLFRLLLQFHNRKRWDWEILPAFWDRMAAADPRPTAFTPSCPSPSLSYRWFPFDMHFRTISAIVSFLIKVKILIWISGYFTKISVKISSHFAYFKS